MTRIGILCPAALGHLNPMGNLGNELQHRGHEVTLFGIPDIKEKIARAQLGFHEIGAQSYPYGSLKSIYEQHGQSIGLAGLKFSIKAFRKGAEMLFKEAPDAIVEAGIELLLIDQLTAAGGTIADYLNLPFITVCNALPINREPGLPPNYTQWGYQDIWWAKLRNQAGYRFLDYLTLSIQKLIRKQRQQWQLPAYRHWNDSGSTLAQLCQVPAVLDFPRKTLPPWFHYVGPLRSPSGIEPANAKAQNLALKDLEDKPLIYASLGTVQSQNWQIFRVIAEACLGMDRQLVIDLGNPDADPAQADFPGAVVLSFAPHKHLIGRASLVITHGGSTVIDCFQAGVPVVVIPITNDQPGMAARVASTGAGNVVPLHRLDAPTLRTAIEAIASHAHYRDSAANLASAIHAAGGVRYAADIVEQVDATGAAVLASADICPKIQV
ncbi:MAG: glycosyl transferase family 1 [Leptolyngbya sp. SIOISBB]|nr:glycosyl transferase family 1 [Leptolyngbya sp. SIOISBB]